MKKINVTKRDIERGVRCNSDLCPIARAAKRVLNEASVYDYELYYSLPETRKMVQLPDVAREFIRRFDRGEPCQPFEFNAVEMEGGGQVDDTD